MSIGILSVFLIEIIVKVYAFRLEFFKQKMEVFDAIVVIVSFALDVAFANEEGLSSGLGLIVLLRLWRVTRILNGKFYTVPAVTFITNHSWLLTSDGNRFQFPKSIIGNKSNSILELESVSWCADCGIWIHNQ